MVDGPHKTIPMGCPVFDEEMEVAAVNALRNERYVLGEDVFKFEEEFARYVGTRYAVSTSSGTNALQLSFLALGLSAGDEVVTSAFSFVASANAVIHAGSLPKFADIDARTYNVDPNEMVKATTKQTRALLPVHLYGYPCNMTEIVDFAKSRGLKVVEDACQGHGGVYKGKKLGAIGDVGCFSFYPSKNMTVCGDGGMIVTDNETVAKTAAKLRDCGRISRYEHDVIGYTSRLNTANAAIGRIQLKRLDDWNRKRVGLASLYDAYLSDIEEVAIAPQPCSGIEPVYHLYVIRAERRDELNAWLLKKGIQCGIHYPFPIPMQPIYRRLFGFKEDDFPQSLAASRSCLSLPMYPFLPKEDIEYICGQIRDFYKTKV